MPSVSGQVGVIFCMLTCLASLSVAAHAYQNCKIGVVGGGVTGLYTAWRLSEKYNPKHICVFEATDRVGGRLYSHKFDGFEREHAMEFGGMRITKSMRLIHGLAKELKIPLTPLNTSTIFNHLRRKTIMNEEWIEGAAPYNVSKEYRRQNAGEILGKIQNRAFGAKNIAKARKALNEGTCWDFDEHLDNMKYRPTGQKSAEVDLSAMILEGSDIESYGLIDDSIGYSSLFSYNIQSNQLMEDDMRVNLTGGFVTGAGYLGFADGFEQVPRRLSKKFAKMGGRIFLNHALVSFNEHHDDDDFHLGFIEQSSGKEMHAQVDRLILSISPGALQRMTKQTNVLFPNNRIGKRNIEDVFAVRPYNAVKAFVSFKDTWWKATGNKNGRIATDLPGRQFFYWDEGKAGSLMMMYCDEQYHEYWTQKGDDHHHDIDLPPTHGKYHGPVFQCPPQLKADLHRQIQEIHSIIIDPADVPEPDQCEYSDWGAAPHYMSWSFWKTGVNNQQTIGRLHAPVDGKKIHIVNEGWSDFQGWVEGGLRSAETFLHDHMNMKGPSFVEEDYLQSYLCLHHPHDDDDDDFTTVSAATATSSGSILALIVTCFVLIISM